MGKGMLETWLDGVVEKVEKIVREEGIPALLKVDRVVSAVEDEARQIKKRSEVLLEQAEKDHDKDVGVVDAEVVEETEK